MTNNPQTAIAIFLAVLVVGLTAIYVFTAKGAQRRKQAIEQVKEQARAALISTRGTPFHNGALAAIDGDELWENPHSEPSEGPKMHVAWAAGWCYGRQMLRQVGGQP